MKYKMLYTAPTCKGENREVTLELNETKVIDNYSVKLSHVLVEPTEDKTGSAIITKTSEFGKVSSETCVIAKVNRGGFREGAGRPKTHGTRHTWVVPEDVEQVVSERGTSYIWDAVRFKLKFDAMQINQ